MKAVHAICIALILFANVGTAVGDTQLVKKRPFVIVGLNPSGAYYMIASPDRWLWAVSEAVDNGLENLLVPENQSKWKFTALQTGLYVQNVAVPLESFKSEAAIFQNFMDSKKNFIKDLTFTSAPDVPTHTDVTFKVFILKSASKSYYRVVAIPSPDSKLGAVYGPPVDMNPATEKNTLIFVSLARKDGFLQQAETALRNSLGALKLVDTKDYREFEKYAHCDDIPQEQTIKDCLAATTKN